GQPQPREKLMALLWEDTDPERARHSLRQTLTLLRQDLAGPAGAQPLLSSEAVCLDPALVSVDVESFQRLSQSAEPDSLERAAALYRGDFLEGLETAGEAFESWLGVERDRLRATGVHVLDRLLAARMAAGATQPAIQTAIRLLGLDPLREDVHRLLI